MDGNVFCTTYNRLPGLVVIRENEISCQRLQGLFRRSKLRYTVCIDLALYGFIMGRKAVCQNRSQRQVCSHIFHLSRRGRWQWVPAWAGVSWWLPATPILRRRDRSGASSACSSAWRSCSSYVGTSSSWQAAIRARVAFTTTPKRCSAMTAPSWSSGFSV